jgi:hypothetical protein
MWIGNHETLPRHEEEERRIKKEIKQTNRIYNLGIGYYIYVHFSTNLKMNKSYFWKIVCLTMASLTDNFTHSRSKFYLRDFIKGINNTFY